MRIASLLYAIKTVGKLKNKISQNKENQYELYRLYREEIPYLLQEYPLL